MQLHNKLHFPNEKSAKFSQASAKLLPSLTPKWWRGEPLKRRVMVGAMSTPAPPYLRETGQMAIFAAPKAPRPEILENWDVATPSQPNRKPGLWLCPPPNLQANGMAI